MRVNSLALIGVAIALTGIVLAVLLYRQEEGQGGGGGAESDGLPATAWDADFQAAERANGLPSGLLRRVAWTESRFDPGAESRAGAKGVMQIIPRWHPGVDPWEPVESIHYAAQYLADLERQYRSWTMALAAYNWGPGNLSLYGIESAPAETRQYVAAISAGMGWT